MKGFKLDNFIGFTSFKKSGELQELLTKEIFTIKSTDIPYRNLRHWDQQGLLLNKRDDLTKWRKFSFVDYVWIKIIDELRIMGASHQLIKALKEQVSEIIPFSLFVEALKNPLNQEKLPGTSEEIAELKKGLESIDAKDMEGVAGCPVLLLAILECIINRVPVSMAVFQDGSCLYITEKDNLFSEEDMERLTFESQIRISVAGIIRGFLADKRSIPTLPQLKLLKDGENKILRMINAEAYSSLTITFKNKKKKLLELLPEEETKRKIVNIFSEGSYSEVILKSTDGLSTKIENL